MNVLLRWMKFNAVGAMGMAVQLGSLAVLNRWMDGHYLLASAAALELTLLHNFVWHLHYTWADRRDETTALQQLVRFHLSSGLVSFAGNLLLMRALVQGAHLHVLAANLIAIACCSVLNFWLGNRWAFEKRRTIPVQGGSMMQIRVFALAAFLLITMRAGAQNGSAPSNPSVQAPQPVRETDAQNRALLSNTYVTHVGIFCGAGASTSMSGTKPTTGCGAGLTFVPLPVFLEAGVMGPQANRSNVSGYISVDGNVPLANLSAKYLPPRLSSATAVCSRQGMQWTTVWRLRCLISRRKREMAAGHFVLNCVTTGPLPTRHNITS